MKKQTLLLSAALMLLVGCGTKKQQATTSTSNESSPFVFNEPIMPIHASSSDTTIIYLTDYLPTLSNPDKAVFTITGDYELQSLPDGMLAIIGNSNVTEVLSVLYDDTNIDIAVLPSLPRAQGFTSCNCFDHCSDYTVTLTFYFKGDEHLGFYEEDSMALDKEEVYYFCALLDNQHIASPISYNNGNTFKLEIPNHEQLSGRNFLRIYATDGEYLYNDILIPLQDGKPIYNTTELNRHDQQAQVLYSLLVDRFYNGNTANDAPLNRPDVDPRVDYMGGDLKGITCKIKEGFFDSLGINTIWISPITQNPTDAWGQYHNPDTKFSGYHGYWPIYNTKIDNRMGTDAELRELLATAHEHDINVVLDYVANHMHIMSPTLQQHPDWVTDSILPDGRRNFELWDECRLTTWFDKHIPTLDLEREEICDAMTDTALYWISNYDFDGYRHDACKHIPLSYWRMFTSKMKSRFPNRSLWMIGETYGDAELIGSYVKTGMLNAQFDFNVYHTAIDVLGKEGESMTRLADVIDESLAQYGSHHTMGNISGNHDKCRFISLAGGAVDWDEDSKDAGWNRQIGVTADGDSAKEAEAYKRALLLEVLNLTLPGVPCIYQGDEYGQAGANDPDNRRMMRFDGYNENEKTFRETVQHLIWLRMHYMELLYGDYALLYCDDDLLVFRRTYLGGYIKVAINKSSTETKYWEYVPIEPLGYMIYDLVGSSL